MQAQTQNPKTQAQTPKKHPEWLGDIPKHWEVKRGNYIFRIVNERSKYGIEELLTVSEHHGVKRRSESNVNMFMAQSYVGYKICWPGDLVINSLWAWSRGLGFSRYHGIVALLTVYIVPILKTMM